MASETGGDGVWEAVNLPFVFVLPMVAKAVCELGIPDILAAQEEPMSALRILESLTTHSITRPVHQAAQQLDRMMRYLSSYGLFKAHVEPIIEGPSHAQDVDEIQSPLAKYSLPSQCLQSAAAMLLFQMSAPMQAPWHHLSHSLLHGSPPFTAAHSMDVWDLAAVDPPLSRLLNSAMASSSQLSLLALLKHYDGFNRTGILTLVDVGGGTGTIASSIVSQYPSIKAINFDLPSVVSTSPIYPGVEHVGGDMFESIPKGDAIFMKWVLHDWDDKSCIKILENC